MCVCEGWFWWTNRNAGYRHAEMPEHTCPTAQVAARPVATSNLELKPQTTMAHCLESANRALGKETSAQRFSDTELLWKPLGVMDVRALGLWMSACQCLLLF